MFPDNLSVSSARAKHEDETDRLSGNIGK